MSFCHRHPNSFNYLLQEYFSLCHDYWNNLNPEICSSTSFDIFRSTLLILIRHVERKTFFINEPFGVKMLTRLKLGFSRLSEHNIGPGFKDFQNLFCPCSIHEVLMSTPYLSSILNCSTFDSTLIMAKTISS